MGPRHCGPTVLGRDPGGVRSTRSESPTEEFAEGAEEQPRDPTNPAPVIILKRPINNPKMNLESDAFQPWNLNEPVPLVFPIFGECRLVP